MESSSASWSNLRASDFAQVHNGHRYNTNNYYNGATLHHADPHEADRAAQNLLKAAKEGQTPCVEAILRERPYLRDYADLQELTALHHASMQGHEDTVFILWQSGSDINARSRLRGTPLCAAALYGRIRNVEFLLQQGADAQADGDLLGSALHACCFSGQVSIAKLLLDRKVPLDELAPVGLEPMENSQLPIPLNGKPFGWHCRPLFIAAYFGHTNLVRLLRAHGAAVDAKAYQGEFPVASSANGPLIVLNEMMKSSALVEAIRHRHRETVHELLRGGADPNDSFDHGKTALTYSIATTRDSDMVSHLIEYGAELDTQDDKGYTAIMRATQLGYRTIVRKLIRAGASVEFREHKGRTALDIATRMGHTQCQRYLQSAST